MGATLPGFSPQRTLLPRPSENQSHNVCSFSILSNSSVTGGHRGSSGSFPFLAAPTWRTQASVPVALLSYLPGFPGSILSMHAGGAAAVGPDSGVGRQVWAADQWFAGTFLPRWAYVALDGVLCSVHFREGSLVHPVHDVFKSLVGYVSHTPCSPKLRGAPAL